ncbi:unnamed protein product [Adineta steineri]|uniref:G-protein coupled receptors family 1 profile domain-containing protein n=1 Tax=Adineta steineri TaxID=433720 RepID=A0A814SJB7_9BILA|nr:unnamed protein product [Adineta steineri]CAF1149092.1 unnamed protein product [Adineta steineri]CAF3578653.1 unnamed protein product [Adineta steineri]CAF3601794.1 unnamed protein product [Adineta steineri]
MSSSLEEYYSLYTNPLTVIRFYQIGYTFTFILGFLGNTASLLTFSRPTLRKVSTGCLFIILAIFDTLYLLMCVFDYLEFGFKVPFYPHIAYSEFCRFRYFVMDVSQVASAWILVIIAIDRWIRTQFPFKSGSICTPKNALIAVIILLVIDIGLHSHMLTPMFGIDIPGLAYGSCGPNYFTDKPYFLFYYIQWSMIQIFTTCVGPVSFMLMTLIAIFINIYLRKRAIIQPTQTIHGNQNMIRQKQMHKQMLILMFAILYIQPVVIDITIIWTALGWIQSLNYAINFYIHCLTSTLFRTEFKLLMKNIFRKNQMRVTVIGNLKHNTHAQMIDPLAKK